MADPRTLARRGALQRAFSKVIGGFPLTPDECDAILRELDAAMPTMLDAAQHITREPMAGWKPSDGYLGDVFPEPHMDCTPGVARVLSESAPAEVRKFLAEHPEARVERRGYGRKGDAS